MNSISKLENTFGEWLKPAPHLPENARSWIAKNLWWINVVGLVLSVLAVVSIIGTIFSAFSAVGSINSFLAYYGVSYHTYDTIWFVSVAISLLSIIVVLVITAMAITPLKNMSKKGWDLLFIASIVSIALNFISNIVSFNIVSLLPSLIGSLIGLAISMYFLFEIRSYFEKSGKGVKDKKAPEFAKSTK